MKKLNTALFYDTETTGLPDWKSPSDSDSQPHIVQLAALLVNVDTRETIASMDVIIKPDGWTISEEVSETHGITTEHALNVGIPEQLALDMFLAIWNGCNRVSHNRTFDQRIIRIAAKRFKSEEIIDAWGEKENHQCSMLMAKPIMELPGKRGFKNPNLAEAYEFFTALEIENAHTALADTKACMDIYFAMTSKGES